MARHITAELHEHGPDPMKRASTSVNGGLFGRDDESEGDLAEASAGGAVQEWARGLLTVAGRRRRDWGN
jgi:hypothetical protein